MRFDNELEQEIQQLVEQAKQTNLTNKSTVQFIDIQIEDLQKQIENLIETKKRLKNKVVNLISQIKKLLPKEFYSCQINKTWGKPLHYRVKSFIYDYDDDTIKVNIQEIRKKKPWENWNGDYTISFEQFKEYSVCDTYEKASTVYQEYLEQLKQRPCPQCGKIIGDPMAPWCKECINKFIQSRSKYVGTYYDPKEDCVYQIKPDLPGNDHVLRAYFDRNAGFYGQGFRLQQLDTDEIMETHNLWLRGSAQNDEDRERLPKILIVEKEYSGYNSEKDIYHMWCKYEYEIDARAREQKEKQEREEKNRQKIKEDEKLNWLLDFE